MLLESQPTEQNRSATSSVASAVLLAIAVLWCIYWFVHAWHYWEDDAFIHLEFARSVAAGRGFAFNGKVVAGDTAPLWVLLLAGMHTLIPDWLIAGKVLTVFGAIVGLSGTYAFARSLASSLLPRSASAAIFPAAMLFLVAANPYSCYWLFFFTVLLALPLIGQWNRLPGRPTSTAKVGIFAAGLALIATPLTLWSIYSLHAFGHVFPNTNAAKRAGPHDSVVSHLLVIYSTALPLILCGLLAGIVYLILRPSAVRRSIQNAIASAFR